MGWFVVVFCVAHTVVWVIVSEVFVLRCLTEFCDLFDTAVEFLGDSWDGVDPDEDLWFCESCGEPLEVT